MTTAQLWISPKKGGGWRTHKPGAQRDSIHTQTKEEAIKRATEIAKNQELELKIQNRNGKICSSNSYGRDPFPPRG